ERLRRKFPPASNWESGVGVEAASEGRTRTPGPGDGKGFGGMHDPGRSNDWNAVGIGHQGFYFDSGRPRDEALPSGPRADALEASGKMGRRERHRAGRISRRRSGGGWRAEY